MKLICEINEEIEVLSEANEAGNKDYYIKGIFMQGDIKNRNGRMYPQDVLAKEVKRYNEEYITKNRAFGELGHPQGPTINLDRASHMIKELYQDGSNFVGKAKIMDTPMGKIVKSLMDEGASIGVSSRGMGSLKPVNGVQQVQNDFYLATAADIVADPSAPDAYVEGIMEGKEWVFDESLGWQAIDIAEQQQQMSKKKWKQIDEAKKLKMFHEFLSKI